MLYFSSARWISYGWVVLKTLIGLGITLITEGIILAIPIMPFMSIFCYAILKSGSSDVFLNSSPPVLRTIHF
jgi:hypothetical protein